MQNWRESCQVLTPFWLQLPLALFKKPFPTTFVFFRTFAPLKNVVLPSRFLYDSNPRKESDFASKIFVWAFLYVGSLGASAIFANKCARARVWGMRTDGEMRSSCVSRLLLLSASCIFGGGKKRLAPASPTTFRNLSNLLKNLKSYFSQLVFGFIRI